MSDNAPLNPAQVATAEQRAAHEAYLHRLLVGLDQFANVISGGNPDETISARSARLAANGNHFGKFMCWWLDAVQAQHGEKAEAGDLARADKVAGLETQAIDTQTQSEPPSE